MVDFDARLDDISDEMNVELVRLQRAVERGDEAQASQSLERLNALARDFIAARQKSLDAIGSFAQDVLTRATAFYRQLRKRQGIAPAYPKPPPPPILYAPPPPGRYVPGQGIGLPRPAIDYAFPSAYVPPAGTYGGGSPPRRHAVDVVDVSDRKLPAGMELSKMSPAERRRWLSQGG
jgi:hypothetical protein